MEHLLSIDFVICMTHLADKILCHWWWTVIFVFQPDVATRWNTNYILQHRTLSSLNTLKMCSLSGRGHFIILNFEPDDQNCYFQTQRYIGVSSKQCIVYRLTDVYRYVLIYWFTPTKYLIFVLSCRFLQSHRSIYHGIGWSYNCCSVYFIG